MKNKPVRSADGLFCAQAGQTGATVPTAEGAIQLALEELPITLHGSEALVIGYGRLGRALAPRLAALGVRVSVAAQTYSALAWIGAEGFHPLRLEEADLGQYHLVVNTVPARVLDEAALGQLAPGCLVLDLASKPGGADVEGLDRGGGA